MHITIVLVSNVRHKDLINDFLHISPDTKKTCSRGHMYINISKHGHRDYKTESAQWVNSVKIAHPSFSLAHKL